MKPESDGLFTVKMRASRGAMLLEADTLERLAQSGDRGVRATNMDSYSPSPANAKNHFAEALVLAS